MIIKKTITIRNYKKPPNKSLSSVLYEIATDKDFSNITISENDDSPYVDDTGSISKTFTLDYSNNTVYYSRVTLKFDDGSIYGPTRPIVLPMGNDIVTSTTSIIATPKITLKQGDPNIVDPRNLEFVTSKFTILKGLGQHLSTDWIIKDMNNEIVFTSLDDKQNLTSIRISDAKLTYNKLYKLHVKYRSTDGNISKDGVFIFRTRKLVDIKNDTLIKNEVPVEELKRKNEMIDRSFYYILNQLAMQELYKSLVATSS